MSRRKLTNIEKIKIGTCCCNCGSTEDLQYDHIVPLALGGFDILSNMCCLCYKCHQKKHGRQLKNGDFSAAVKAGIARAKAEGKRIGNEKGTKLETAKAKRNKAIILQNSIDFNGSLSDVECLALCDCVRNSYYKYKKELKEQLEKQQT